MQMNERKRREHPTRSRMPTNKRTRCDGIRPPPWGNPDSRKRFSLVGESHRKGTSSPTVPPLAGNHAARSDGHWRAWQKPSEPSEKCSQTRNVTHRQAKSTCNAGPMGVRAPDRRRALTLTSRFSGLCCAPMRVSLTRCPSTQGGSASSHPKVTGNWV